MRLRTEPLHKLRQGHVYGSPLDPYKPLSPRRVRSWYVVGGVGGHVGELRRVGSEARVHGVKDRGVQSGCRFVLTRCPISTVTKHPRTQ